MTRTRLIVLLLVAVLLLAGGAVAVRKLGLSEESRRQQLLPTVRTQLDALRAELSKMGIETFVGSTYRSSAQQDEIFEESGTSSTRDSWHELRRAVDLKPIDPKTGKPDDAGKTWDTLFRTMHEVAKRRGWRGIAFNADGSKKLITNSAGKKVWDGGHLEWRDGLTFAQAEAQYVATKGTA